MIFNSGSYTELYERVDRNRARRAPCPTLDNLALTELRRLAAGAGMKLIELDDLLEADYRVHRRALDYKPVDSHWNRAATDLTAAEIVRLLGPLPARTTVARP